jgi:hypothetical protein
MALEPFINLWEKRMYKVNTFRQYAWDVDEAKALSE